MKKTQGKCVKNVLLSVGLLYILLLCGIFSDEM